jgi:hypothetical protein
MYLVTEVNKKETTMKKASRFNSGRVWLAISAVVALALAAALPLWGFASAQPVNQSKNAASTVHCADIAGPEGLPDWFNLNTRFGIDVRFVNQTQWPLVVSTSQVDCFDFSGDQNPSMFDGLKVGAQSSSTASRIIARKVCPWLDGDIIGKFQEREAHWATSASLDGLGTINLPTTLFCSSRRHVGTICTSGNAQDNDSYLVKLDRRLIRVTYSCIDQAVTISVKTEI